MRQMSCSMIKLLLIGVLFSSCKKDTLPNKAASEYFPNKVGDYWEYEIDDSTASKQYSVTIRITGVQKLVDGIDAYVWEYQYPWGKDINYVRMVGDTIKVFDTLYSTSVYNLNFPRKLFLIPFQNEQRWDGKLLAIDSFHVSGQPAISATYNSFTDGFKIYHHYLGPNMEYNDSYYFVPQIGMVKMFYYKYNFAPPTKVLWQLKKYYLQ
jgi:hypothetical protein